MSHEKELIINAIKSNDTTQLKFLIESAGIDCNFTTNDVPLIQYAAKKKCSVEVMDILIKNTHTDRMVTLFTVWPLTNYVMRLFNKYPYSSLLKTIIELHPLEVIDNAIHKTQGIIPESTTILYISKYEKIPPCLNKFKITSKVISTSIGVNMDCDSILKLLRLYRKPVSSRVLIKMTKVKCSIETTRNLWFFIKKIGYKCKPFKNVTPLESALKYNKYTMVKALLCTYGLYQDNVIVNCFPLTKPRIMAIEHILKNHKSIPLTIEQIYTVHNNSRLRHTITKYAENITVTPIMIRDTMDLINSDFEYVDILKYMPLRRTFFKYIFRVTNYDLLKKVRQLLESVLGGPVKDLTESEVRYLISRGWYLTNFENINEYKGPIEPLLRHAIYKKKSTVVHNILIHHDNINITCTPPLLCMKETTEDITKAIINYAKDQRTRRWLANYGNPLMYTCDKNTVATLLKAGANPNNVELIKKLLDDGQYEIIKLLLEYTLSPNICIDGVQLIDVLHDHDVDDSMYMHLVYFGCDPFLKNIKSQKVHLCIMASLKWFHKKETMRACFKKIPNAIVQMRTDIHSPIATGARWVQFASRYKKLKIDEVPPCLWDFFGTYDIKCLIVRVGRYLEY